MSESINNTSFGGVVGRHLHFHPVADCKTNESLAHPSRDVCENNMVIRQRDAKHRSGKHRLDRALNFNGLFRIHDVVFVRLHAWQGSKGRPFCTSADNQFLIYQRLPAKERFPP